MLQSKLSHPSGLFFILTFVNRYMFRNDNYDKIGEMFAFRRACLNSGMRRLVSVECSLMDIAENSLDNLPGLLPL